MLSCYVIFYIIVKSERNLRVSFDFSKCCQRLRAAHEVWRLPVPLQAAEARRPGADVHRDPEAEAKLGVSGTRYGWGVSRSGLACVLFRSSVLVDSVFLKCFCFLEGRGSSYFSQPNL